jgi:hypothetical protein
MQIKKRKARPAVEPFCRHSQWARLDVRMPQYTLNLQPWHAKHSRKA